MTTLNLGAPVKDQDDHQYINLPTFFNMKHMASRSNAAKEDMVMTEGEAKRKGSRKSRHQTIDSL